jgi:hypothetical protein
MGWRAALGAGVAVFGLAPAAVVAAPIDSGAEGSLARAERLSKTERQIPVGCVGEPTAAGLNELLRARFGPVIGWDNPKIIDLGGGRALWLLSDPYVDPTLSATTLRDEDFLHNTAVVQIGSCFSVFQRMNGVDPVAFVADLPDGDFFWPLGGTLGADGLIYVFWSQMREDPPYPEEGITRHPVATWLAAYDPQTFAMRRFALAPNAGVYPQYGSAVQTAGGHTYLFGNSNMLNLTIEGGPGAEPFTGTRTYLARVPAGQLTALPQYFTGSTWSDDPAAANPISARWRRSNAMQPRLIDGQWFSVVKRDEWWGGHVVVERASAPEGPWTVIAELPAIPRVPSTLSTTFVVTYQPVLLPRRGPDGRLIAILSQNAADFELAIASPELYRPQAVAVPG